MVLTSRNTIFQIFLEILKNEVWVYYRYVHKKTLEKDATMFEILTLTLTLAGLVTALYRVTYPTCTARRCHHTNH